jgi:hypothetical protein
MATQLQIVNSVLTRLRESTVSSVASSDYSKLIGEFVNDAKSQMEDMWFWTVNETEIDTSILGDSSTREYDLTATTDRSFLIRAQYDQTPMAYDVTSSENAQLCDIPLKDLREFRNTARTIDDTLAQPVLFSLKPDSDGRGWSIELQQASSSARTWRTYWYVPQADLAVDGTADSTEILLPARPIRMLALYAAQYERGEAQPGGKEEQDAHTAVAAAMELDMQTHKKSDQKDMTNLEFLRNEYATGGSW